MILHTGLIGLALALLSSSTGQVGRMMADAAPLEDLVESLPDYGPPPTPHFSGFLDGTAGCDTAVNGDFCHIHYWLALAEENPLEQPIVLWLNGGPGSTSILGFLQENGPLLINNDGGLVKNPWSWTKKANLIAIESPVGVGYSYCAKQLEGEMCQNTDKFTASTARAALQSFFVKFPEFAANDFFITGESYAGVYIPTLSKEILDNAPEINLVGIAVGDPCTDNTAQQDSMDSLWYGHKYGLVDDQIFDQLWNHCNVRLPTILARGGTHLVAAKLNNHLKNVVTGLDDKELVDYAHAMHRRLVISPESGFTETPECLLAFRKYLLSSSYHLSQVWKDLYIDDYSLFAPVTNKQDDDMAAYMSRDDVRRALHVQETPVDTWPYDPAIGFDYTKEYDACNAKAEPDAWSMIDFYRDIVPRLRSTFIYNGDTDPCVSYEGTRTAVKRIGIPELDGGSYRPWFYNETAATLDFLAEKAPLFGPNLMVQELGAQFAGEIVNYEEGLAFLTFHGSGHMVPQFRPQAALHMLDKLVNNEMLSPLLPTNATLVNAGHVEFKELMEDWTESARQEPYVQKQEEEEEEASRRHNVAQSWEQVFSVTETLATGKQPVKILT